MKLFSIPELVNGSNLNTVLGIQYHQCRIRDIQSGNSSSHEIIRTRTIDEIQLPILPFYTENG